MVRKLQLFKLFTKFVYAAFFVMAFCVPRVASRAGVSKPSTLIVRKRLKFHQKEGKPLTLYTTVRSPAHVQL